MGTYDQLPTPKRQPPFSTVEPTPAWSGPGSGWNARTPTSDDQRFRQSGAAKAPVPSNGGANVGDFDTGQAMNDMDADDLPMQGNGTAQGHADCVPDANGNWPGQGRQGA